MRNRSSVSLLVVVLVGLASYSVRADVRSDEKTHVEFAGMLGRMVNMFGGKAAREGTTSMVAVKGDRMARINDTTGQIVDLADEKVYDLDMKKKVYHVTTFAELRRRMEEAKKKAEEDARKAEGNETKTESAPPPENNIEVDFNVKNTGERKTINGYETHESVMTITVREKGKTLEQGGGLVTTADMWLAPRIPAMKEIVDFQMRYAQKLYGPMVVGASAEQMAAAMALYPMMKQAIARMNVEGQKLDGTAILTTVTMESVKSADQIAAEAKKSESESKPNVSGGVGGLIGGFGKKVAAKKMGGEDAAKARTTFMNGTTEVLKVLTDVAPTDVAVPVGFKEAK